MQSLQLSRRRRRRATAAHVPATLARKHLTREVWQAAQSSAADEPAEKRPTKRLRKSAEAEAPQVRGSPRSSLASVTPVSYAHADQGSTEQVEAPMPVDLVDDDEQPEALQVGPTPTQ